MKSCLKVFGFGCVFIFSIIWVADILETKANSPVVEEFYQQNPKEIQVVAIGSSHMQYGISPMYI